MEVKTKTHKLKKTKGLFQLHAISRLVDMLRYQVTAPYMGSKESEYVLNLQVQDFLQPSYAIRLSDNELFAYDPEHFTYFKTADGLKGELVFYRSVKHLKSIKLTTISPVQRK